MAPEGWFYMEAKDDEDPEATIIVLACSEACKNAMWKVGPGPRFTAEEMGVPVDHTQPET